MKYLKILNLLRMYDNLAKLLFSRENSGENMFYSKNKTACWGGVSTHRQKHKSVPMYTH